MEPIKISEEEEAQIYLIINKINCSKQALKVFPENAKQEDIEKYLNSVMSIQAGYQWLLNDWWKKAINKYHLENAGPLNFKDGYIVLGSEKCEMR